MSRWTKFAALLLAVVPFAAPTMACLVPNPELTPQERECCRQMAGDCKEAEMPASHACCDPVIAPEPVALTVTRHNSAVHLVALFVQPAALPAILDPVATSFHFFLRTHSPPEPPPGSLEILRI